MALRIIESEWKDFTSVDKPTYELAKKIEAMAGGLTPKQFTEAISIALDAISRYSILSIQPVQVSNEQY